MSGHVPICQKINPKNYIPRYIIIKLLETKVKENILNAAREKWYLTLKEKQTEKTMDFLSETIVSKRKRHIIMFKCWRERSVNPEFYTQWKYPVGIKGKSIHSQMKGN